MSRSVNKVTLVGNVGADPEIRTLPSGHRVGRISLATSKRWTDKNDQEHEDTQWHRLTVWEKLAELVEKYVSKGDRLYIEGEIRYSKFNPEGVKKADGTAYEAEGTEIHVRELVMLGSPRGQREAPDGAAANVCEDCDADLEHGGHYPNCPSGPRVAR